MKSNFNLTLENAKQGNEEHKSVSTFIQLYQGRIQSGELGSWPPIPKLNCQKVALISKFSPLVPPNLMPDEKTKTNNCFMPKFKRKISRGQPHSSSGSLSTVACNAVDFNYAAYQFSQDATVTLLGAVWVDEKNNKKHLSKINVSSQYFSVNMSLEGNKFVTWTPHWRGCDISHKKQHQALYYHSRNDIAVDSTLKKNRKRNIAQFVAVISCL